MFFWVILVSACWSVRPFFNTLVAYKSLRYYMPESNEEELTHSLCLHFERLHNQILANKSYDVFRNSSVNELILWMLYVI